MNKIHIVTTDQVYSPEGQLLFQFIHGRSRLTKALQEAMQRDLLGKALALEVEKKRGALYYEMYNVTEKRQGLKLLRGSRSGL